MLGTLSVSRNQLHLKQKNLLEEQVDEDAPEKRYVCG